MLLQILAFLKVGKPDPDGYDELVFYRTDAIKGIFTALRRV